MSESLNTEYKKIVKHILDNGVAQASRNGDTLIIPHYSFTVDDMVNEHLLTLRKMYTNGILGEFKTLISNEMLFNVSQFEANGCNYWSKWSGPNGELNLDYWNELHPALEKVIEQIKQDPHSRRHVVSLWNNENAFNDSLSLHSCWHNLTFSVIEDTLHLTWAQRSVDTMIGLPSDVYLAYLFMENVSIATGYKIGSCMFALSNVHIYEDHLLGAAQLLKRTEKDFDKPLKFKLL